MLYYFSVKNKWLRLCFNFLQEKHFFSLCIWSLCVLPQWYPPASLLSFWVKRMVNWHYVRWNIVNRICIFNCVFSSAVIKMSCIMLLFFVTPICDSIVIFMTALLCLPNVSQCWLMCASRWVWVCVCVPSHSHKVGGCVIDYNCTQWVAAASQVFILTQTEWWRQWRTGLPHHRLCPNHLGPGDEKLKL